MNFFGGLASLNWGCPSGLKGLVGRTTRCKKFIIFLARKNWVVVQCQDWTKIDVFVHSIFLSMYVCMDGWMDMDVYRKCSYMIFFLFVDFFLFIAICFHVCM